MFSKRAMRKGLAFLLSLLLLVGFLPTIGEAKADDSLGASLTITSPSSGQTILRGQTHPITWTYAGDAGRYVRVQLYQGGQLKSTLSSYVSIGKDGTGTYSWKVSSTLPEGDDYQIKVTSTTKSSINAMSGVFSIKSISPFAINPIADTAKPLETAEEKLGKTQVQAEEKPTEPPTLPPSGLDLTITQIKMQPDPANLGANVTFSVTVKNGGNVTCPSGAVVKITYGSSTKTKTISALGPQASSTINVAGVTLPVASKGEMSIQVDPPPGTSDVNPYNNRQMYNPNTLKPDLTVTKITALPYTAAFGAPVKVTVTVKNLGPGTCPAGATVKLTGSPGTPEATQTSSTPVAKGSERQFIFQSFPMPSTATDKLTADVLAPPDVEEVSTDNNSLSFKPSLPEVDLAITGISTSPSKAAPGTPVKVTVKVKNQGPGTCPAGATVKLTGSPGALSVQTISQSISKNSQTQVVFNSFPMPSNTSDKLIAQLSAPSGATEVSNANNTASLQPNLLLPTVQFVSLTSSGYWSQEGGKPALGDPIIFKVTLKNTSSYQITNLPVQLSYQGQAIKTNYVNINPKSSTSTQFDAVVHPYALPANQNTVTYTVTVNPPGPGSLLISPSTLSKNITLEILKTGTVYVIIRQPDDSPFDEGGFYVTLKAGSYYKEINTGAASLGVFRDVPIGVNLQVTAGKPGYMGYNGQDSFSGMLTSSSMDVKLYLTNMGSAAVRAKSQATGNFLAGVTVEVVGTGQQNMTTQTNPASFSLASGTYTFRLSKRGFAPTTVTGTVRPGQVSEITGTMSYTSTVTLSGRVEDDNGNPLANQKIDIVKWGSNSVVTSTTTDASGNYTVTFDNRNLDPMYLKAVKGMASGRSQPECFYPGLRYRVDLIVSPPPPSPPASGWHEIKKKGCARAIAASVPDTFFTQGWDVSTVLGIFGIRLKYRNEYSEIAELKVELAGGPAAIYNVNTEYNGGEILGEAVSGAAQAAIPTLSDNAADALSFLVEEYAPGITLSAEGGVGRTIVSLERLDIIDRDSGQVLWASNAVFDTLNSGYAWTSRSYPTGGVEWSKAVIRAYLYLDGTDMLGPPNDRCKMISWDVAKKKVRYFNAPKEHPRFNVGD